MPNVKGMTVFQPIDPQILPQKMDPQDPRMAVLLKSSNAPLQVTLQGYPDDEGIRLNGGRLGAAMAPDTIRGFFYKLTPWFSLAEDILSLQDHGNLKTQNIALPQRHEEAFKAARAHLEQNKFLFTMGGGHDYGFPDAAAFLDFHFSHSSKKPVVLNFDAHLDVRPADQSFHSGTPFRRLLEKYGSHFHFVEVGIQPQCHSWHHLHWLNQQKGLVIGIDQIEKKGLLASLKSALQRIPAGTPLWISTDIDGFSQTEAPGCSQSWVRGFSLKEFLPSLEFLIQKFHLHGMGLYEVSPPLDVDHRTSKLAALIMHQTLLLQSQKLHKKRKKR